MEFTDTQDHIDQFVLSLIRTGLLLTDIAGELAEALPDDAYPGEEPGAVVIEMMSGTIRTGSVRGVMTPCVGRSKPASMLSVVVLPEPEGPRKVRNSPRPIVKFKRRTAWKGP